ncbi:MAG: thioesterase family protein [Acidimicrobiia bacterium]|nr:MAG: thioesterase family protein [Acidimicrobiia bacterium]
MSRFDAVAAAVEIAEKHIPFNQVLGLHSCTIDDDRSVHIRIDHRDELVGNVGKGFLHGGVISAALDLVGGIAAMIGAVGRDVPETEEEAAEIFSRIGTIDLRVDYLRPGVGRWYDASGLVLRTGARVAVTRMEMHNDQGSLIAVGTGTYTVGR